jgi:hypothetical protein
VRRSLAFEVECYGDEIEVDLCKKEGYVLGLAVFCYILVEVAFMG